MENRTFRPSIRTAELALLAAATLAGGLKAPLGALLPVACTELRPGPWTFVSAEDQHISKY